MQITNRARVFNLFLSDLASRRWGHQIESEVSLWFGADGRDNARGLRHIGAHQAGYYLGFGTVGRFCAIPARLFI